MNSVLRHVFSKSTTAPRRSGGGSQQRPQPIIPRALMNKRQSSASAGSGNTFLIASHQQAKGGVVKKLSYKRVGGGTKRRRSTTTTSAGAKPKVAKAPGSVEQTWYNSSRPTQTLSLDMGQYGLKRIDYSKLAEPPVWTLPPHPPNKSWADRIIYPTTLLAIGATFLYVYLNPEEEDMKEYWQRVESGQILYDDEDDDDDDDWEDDDEED